MWSGALPKAGGPGGDRTRAQSRTCILSLTSCPPPLVTGTQYPPPHRGPGANPGANPGKGWPDWEASTQGGVAAAWQTPLPPPPQLPAFAVLLQQQPWPVGLPPSELGTRMPHAACRAGCRWLALCPCTHPGPESLACPSGQCLATWFLGPCCLPLGTRLPWLLWA